jgi:hypothetical protein
VEKCGKDGAVVATKYLNALRACSGCAGDYEDPDCTARPEEAEWADEEYEAEMSDEEDFLDGETKPQE